MAMDSTAKKANIRLSSKKYFEDTFVTAGSKKVFFDDLFSIQDKESLSEWISIKFGDMHRSGLSNLIVDIACATRNDPDGDSLAELVDFVFENMTDSDQPDGKLRIDFYDTSQAQWVQIGALLVQDIIDSNEMTGPDGTKYQVLTCQIRWVAKA